MKTRAIEFRGYCSLGRCGSHNDTPSRGGVEFSVDDDVSEYSGEIICCECAEWLAKWLKKRAKQARERQAAGLEYRHDRWCKKVAPEAPTAPVVEGT